MHAVIGKVFINGNSQAIRLPEEFHLDTEEVLISLSGNILAITPHMNSWTGFTEGLSGFSEDFSVTNGLSADTPRKAFE